MTAVLQSQHSSGEQDSSFNPYVYISGTIPQGDDSQNELKTATALGFYFNDNQFCLAVGFNAWYTLKENTEVFILFLLDEHELIENHKYVLSDPNDAKACCFDKVMICNSPEYCIFDWDIGTNVTRVDALNKDIYALSSMCKYIYLKYRLLQIEHGNVLNKLKIRKKFVDDWIVNSIIDATKRKLKRCVKNNKSDFQIQFKYIPKAIVLSIIGCYNEHTRKKKTFVIGWNKNRTSFDSKKENACCPEWVFDAVLFEGNTMVLVNDEKDMIYRFYDCYTKYIGRLGTFTLGSALMHKNKHPNSNWQK